MMEEIRHHIADGYVEERIYEPKEVVFARASQEDGMFIIEDGAVELYISNGSKKRTVDILLPGDVLGLMSGKGHTKNYVAKALTRTYALHITADNLKRLGDINPQLVLNLFLSTLSKQAYLYEVLKAISTYRATDRIRNILYLLGRVAEERDINITVKKKQIAGMAGLSYEGTVRTMRGVRSLESRRIRLW